jgi:cell division protein FtsW (lipid II flippase)
MMYATEEKTFVRRFAENLDWLLVVSVAFLVMIGLIGIYSATLHYGNASKFMVTQGMAVMMGLAGMILLLSFN